ncbi:hypothetical protein JKP88DRAFT_310977 [Tribonema minus]|uniref:Uncharacterized protein n=1 Tax=Tribonema minus TaxID=303371 RepID=A0A835Z4A2_9STRA|nr:hypothetical protein JKP88DRAFT_310977 [Tribonema minus]
MDRLPADFASLPAGEKLAIHMDRMQQSAYKSPLPAVDPGWSIAKVLIPASLAASFLNDTDERNPDVQGNAKPVHTEGVSGAVELVPEPGTKYTGIFQSGGIGILRLSRAANLSPFTPGLALKILVDGRPSVNFHAMYSLDGQKSDGATFRHPFTTHVDPGRALKIKAGALLFRIALPSISDDPAARPVDTETLPQLEAASIRADGAAVDMPNAPAAVRFLPQLQPAAAAVDPDEFREDVMAQVKPGDLLYVVEDGEGRRIGELRTTSAFVASAHGDGMFFRHQRISGASACPVAHA